MRRILYTAQFRKDFKRIAKQGREVEKLKTVITKLAKGDTLEEKYKDHALHGKYSQARDCHVGPDWILIYAIVEDELRLIRTGSHAELFK
jgi:mRNA interferase YafQ